MKAKNSNHELNSNCLTNFHIPILAGYCDYPCQSDSNCNSRQICECGTCMHECNKDRDCLTDQVCRKG